ncbi:MAG: 30S ribosomal protein S4 [Dehalococcoidia bacterium]|nr:30S ribosomal protein S4 [Dehalococcoidia bacterium]
MGRYTGPVCRLCRQVGEKLFLKGARCYTPHCAIEKHRRAPGSQRPTRRRLSEFGIRQREKQKLRYTFGIMERQFARYVDMAEKQPGVTGQYLFQLLERRLDNVVFRLGFSDSRAQGRQLVLHGHMLVNGRKVDIPSFFVKAGDTVTWRPASKEKPFAKAKLAEGSKQTVPGWLSRDAAALEGKVLSLPRPEDSDIKMDARLIVEHYTR